MNSLKLSIADINQLMNNEVEYEITLTDEQLKAVPNVKSVSELFAYFTSYESDNGYLVHVEIEGVINVLDQFTAKYSPLEISEKEDIIISEDSSVTDIQMKRGEFDFFPVLLALFYSAVPLRYSSKKIEYEENEGYTLMSEDAFDEISKKSEKKEEKNNPFASLDPTKFE
ncbi:MAG: hypothetical protein WCR63_05100 [Bacilli bacterium]